MAPKKRKAAVKAKKTDVDDKPEKAEEVAEIKADDKADVKDDIVEHEEGVASTLEGEVSKGDVPNNEPPQATVGQPQQPYPYSYPDQGQYQYPQYAQYPQYPQYGQYPQYSPQADPDQEYYMKYYSQQSMTTPAAGMQYEMMRSRNQMSAYFDTSRYPTSTASAPVAQTQPAKVTKKDIERFKNRKEEKKRMKNKWLFE